MKVLENSQKEFGKKADLNNVNQLLSYVEEEPNKQK